MWPSLKDGQEIVCTKYTGQQLSVGQIVIFNHPFDNRVTAAKRVTKLSNDMLFVEGDNPDPTASDDSHNFGKISIDSIIALVE